MMSGGERPDGVSLTNLDQPLFDGADATKRDLVDYLDAVADHIIPELADRPLSVVRVLRGQAPFIQKNVPSYTPSWVRRVSLWAETSKRDVSYALCNDRRTLLWFANQRAVEYHPTLIRADRWDRPTHLVLTTLFAALEVATGQVTDACHPRHRHGEFLDFLKLVARAYPRRQLHVVLDNDATHTHAKVQAWLARHPRIQLHFTPTYGSWLNLVEVFFAIIERQALRRGDFASVQELMAAIRRFCDGWNQRCQPFAWAKDADQILTKLNRQTTSATDH